MDYLKFHINKKKELKHKLDKFLSEIIHISIAYELESTRNLRIRLNNRSIRENVGKVILRPLFHKLNLLIEIYCRGNDIRMPIIWMHLDKALILLLVNEWELIDKILNTERELNKAELHYKMITKAN